MGAPRIWTVVYRSVLVSAVALVASCGVEAEETELGWTDYLEANGFTGDLADLYVLRSHRVFQISSYDRMGGDEDDAYHIETTDEGLVLAELRGPGAILRIWSSHPQGVLRMYIDGEPWPRFNWGFRDVFSGRVVPFRSPLVSVEGGGYCSYVPVPYADSCRIVLAGYDDEIYYHVTACTFEEPADLKSFESDLVTSSERSYFRNLRRVWKRPGRFGAALDLGHLVTHRKVIWPGATMEVAALHGPGVIEGFWLELGSRDTRCANNMLIEAYWDGETDPSVLAVVSDFFGTRYTNEDFRSVPLGNRAGQMYCYFPMPFRTEGRIVLRNLTNEKVVARTWIAWRQEKALGEHIGLFHAQSRMTVAEAGTPVTVLDARGRGQYVGCVMSAHSAETLQFLDGDDKMFIDGELTPSIHGTGTDHYFNAGQRFAGEPFATATHGATAVSATVAGHQVTAYRFHLTDYVPFARSFLMQFEHGDGNEAAGAEYRTTAFWYQTEPHVPQRTVSPIREPAKPATPGLVRLLERRPSIRERKAAEARAAAQAAQQQQQQPLGFIQVAPAPGQTQPSQAAPYGGHEL